MNKADQILKKHQLRITPFRREVIDLFYNAGHALSSSEIEQKLKAADRITLYRTLRSFEDKGIIHKAIDGTQVPKFAVCDAQCDEHYHHDEHVHFRCVKCENTFCLEHVFVPKVDLPSGFTVKQTDMIVSGVCEKCD